jgi:hypothetical protein
MALQNKSEEERIIYNKFTEEYASILIIAAIIVLLLTIILFQYAWNNAIRPIFNLKEITFWQSFLLIFIIKLISPNCSVC